MRLFFFLFLLSASVAQAENVTTHGTTTFISLAKDLSKYGSLNFYHYDVTNFEKASGGGKSFHAGVVQSYFQTSYSYQMLPWITLTGGHIFQRSSPFEEEHLDEHRIFQQVLFLSGYLTHRFRFEERFIQDTEGAEFKTRLRYQIGARVPLRGMTLDAQEFYVNTYNEFYFSTTGERNALYSDDWFFLGLGYRTREWGSIEMGPLVQWSRINREKDTRTHYTLQMGWLYRFK